MNDKLLLRHKVNISSNNIYFLNFIHPHYEIIDNLDDYENPKVLGIIYTGKVSENTVSHLNSLTKNWIIINEKDFDVDLTSNEGLVKSLLPVYYNKIKTCTPKNEIPVYNRISYESLIEQIKCMLISGEPIKEESRSNSSVYTLFESILSTPLNLSRVYFSIVNDKNINILVSAIFTFLSKVQTKSVYRENANYARLIEMSNKRYGKYIKSGILKYAVSKCKKELALYNLLTYLNQAR